MTDPSWRHYPSHLKTHFHEVEEYAGFNFPLMNLRCRSVQDYLLFVCNDDSEVIIDVIKISIASTSSVWVIDFSNFVQESNFDECIVRKMKHKSYQ